MSTHPLELTVTDMSAVLRPILLPDAVVATRASSLEPWQRASLRSALHSQWLFLSWDSYRVPTRVVLDHNVVVDVGGLTLGHPRLAGDALTRRLTALAAMNRATCRRFDARGLGSLLYSLDWFTRWRLSLEIGRNSDLEKRHFDDYVRLLRSGAGVAHLVPIMRRIANLANAEAAEAQAGFRADGSRWSRLNSQRLADLLGVTSNALLSSPALRLEITRQFGDLVEVSLGRGRIAANQTLSARRLEQLLLPWHVLADMSARDLLPHEPLGFSPFNGDDNSVADVAKRNGVINSRLAIAPPYYLALLDAAARWVLDYAPHLFHALATMRDELDLREPGGRRAKEKAAHRRALSLALNKRLPPGMPRLALTWRLDGVAFAGDPPRIGMTRAVTHLMTACLVIVAGLGARSISDALALCEGCVTEPEPGVHELALHLKESIRDLDAMPVPAVVAHAVRVLERLTADTRAVTGDDRLFRFVRRPWAMSKDDPVRRPKLGFPKNGYLTDFATACKLPPSDPETLVTLTGDQLRLGFAVAYHHVTPGLPIEALTRALGQFDPLDTLAYVERSLPGAAARLTELVRARESTHRDAAGQAGIDELRSLLGDLRLRAESFEAIRCDAAFRLLKGIVDGVDLPGGAGGERLVLDVQAVVDRVRRRVRLGGRNHPEAERDQLWSELQTFVRSHRIDVVPGRHAHCTCRPGNEADLAKAQCRVMAREALPWDGSPRAEAATDRPDYAQAGMLSCLTCDHGAAFAADRAVVGAACTGLAGGGGPVETGSARVARLARLAELRAALEGAAPSSRRIV